MSLLGTYGKSSWKVTYTSQYNIFKIVKDIGNPMRAVLSISDTLFTYRLVPTVINQKKIFCLNQNAFSSSKAIKLPHFSVASLCRCFLNLSSPKKHNQICFHFGAFGGSVCVVRSMVDVCDWDCVDLKKIPGSYCN